MNRDRRDIDGYFPFWEFDCKSELEHYDKRLEEIHIKLNNESIIGKPVRQSRSEFTRGYNASWYSDYPIIYPIGQSMINIGI